MPTTPLIIGSIAYDRIFSIEGNVRDKILVKNDQIQKIDMTFRADEPKILYGGSAGNIAYGLGLLNTESILVAAVGDDFRNNYQPYLEKLKVKLKIHNFEEKQTATFYGINDSEFQTISIWQPNASQFIEEIDLATQLKSVKKDQISTVIVSPSGKPFALAKFILEAKNLLSPETRIIFDPGQDLAYLKKAEVIDCLQNSSILILNDVEFEQLKSLFQLKIKDIFNYGIEYIIETKGEDGSEIHIPDKRNILIPIAKPKKVAQVTGAGDAFRSGLIYGLNKGDSIETSAKYGAVMGSFCVEEHGGQGYESSMEDFKERFNANF